MFAAIIPTRAVIQKRRADLHLRGNGLLKSLVPKKSLRTVALCFRIIYYKLWKSEEWIFGKGEVTMKTLIAVILIAFAVLFIMGCAVTGVGYGYHHGHSSVGVIIAEPPPRVYVYPYYYYPPPRPGPRYYYPPPATRSERPPGGRTDRQR
jgi:hypothetical protein